MSAPRGVIGVIHLAALPGDPQGARSFQEVEALALADAEALHRGGVNAIIVENFGSVPFPKGTRGHRLAPHQVAAMAIIVRRVRDLTRLPVGVNCLRNDARSAIGVAAAAGASFIRVNVHSGAYVTDQGIIEGEADATLRYRHALGADVAIVADVLVKHATPLSSLTPTQAVAEAFDRALADAVVVTGTGTGAPVSQDVLRQARDAAGERPVLIGSGMTQHDVALAALAHGAIVGTSLKRDGDVRNPVDEQRVRALVEALGQAFRR